MDQICEKGQMSDRLVELDASDESDGSYRQMCQKGLLGQVFIYIKGLILI